MSDANEVDEEIDESEEVDEIEEETDEEVDGNRAEAGDGSVDTAVAVCEYLAKAVVTDPDGVSVSVYEDDGRLELQVAVSDGDMGRVIGRRGRVAKAIRTVVRAAAVRDGAEVDVEFLD